MLLFENVLIFFSYRREKGTLTERLNGTANTRGIAGKKSRRALWCKGDVKKSIKLTGGGWSWHLSPPLHFRSTTVLSVDPVFALYWKEHDVGSSPPGLRCHYLSLTRAYTWPYYLISLSSWKIRIMCPGSLGQLVQCQAYSCSHIDHLIWWTMWLPEKQWIFYKHLLFLKGYDLRSMIARSFDRTWLFHGAWDNILLEKHIPLILSHDFNLLFSNMPACDSDQVELYSIN